MSKVRTLIVEDESIVAMDIERRLDSLGYQVVGHVLSGEDAVERTEEVRPDLVLMDIHLKGEMDGIEAADKIRRFYDVPVIYITAYSDEATLERAKVTEPFGYILKPFQEREIHSAIEMAVYKHRAEQELREAKEAAVEGYRVRSEFLANISHELRTPLNSILGMSQLAMETEEKEERNEYLRMVKASGSHLLNLISSILDFSKMEAGKIELVEEPFRLDVLIEELLFQMRESEGGEELRLYVDVDEKSNLALRGDASRLRQVLQNLVHNAMKFTSSGSIEVRAWTEDLQRGGKILLKTSVSDTGIGIPSEEKEEIFSMFYKLNNSLTRVHGGTGLGLTIVKNLLELMGGEIELESEEGRGSTFTFAVPLSVDREDMSPSPSLPTGTRIQIVGDDAHAADIRRRQLVEWGASVSISEPSAIEGNRSDVWIVLSACAMGKRIIERLLSEEVPEERILLLSLRRGIECEKLSGVTILFEPVVRQRLYKALTEATAAPVPPDAPISFSIPVRPKEKEEKRSHNEGSDLLVREMLLSFVGSAEKLLEEENHEELEETALQIKQELERYGFHEFKESLFKLVLAGRKRDTVSIKKTLHRLKEEGSSLRIGE